MHATPTPRGGGLSFVIVFLISAMILAFFLGVPSVGFAALLGGGAVAWIGTVDDRSHVSPAKRAAVHLIASGSAVALIDSTARGTALTQPAMWVGQFVLAVIASAYLLNLFNFMDGLDGLAASEAAFAGIAGGALTAWAIDQTGDAGWEKALTSQGHLMWVSTSAALVGICCIGFLMFNWPPAKIFMGDVGSGFLGIAFAILTLTSALADSRLLWVWMILLAAFIADATYTLLVRVVTGQRWFEAHRLHGFQKLGLKWGSHKRVTLAFLSVNVLWLLPLAAAAVRFPRLGILLTVIAYLPLLAVAAMLRAGIKEEQPVSATSVAQ